MRGLTGPLFPCRRLATGRKIRDIHLSEDAPFLRADARGSHFRPSGHISPRKSQRPGHALLTALVKLAKPVPEVFRRWGKRQFKRGRVDR